VVSCSSIMRGIGSWARVRNTGWSSSTGSWPPRLRILAEVVDHLGASGKTGIVDGTEIRVRRPAAGRKDRGTFISGKSKQNAVKSMVVTDGDGRVLFCSRKLCGPHPRPSVGAGRTLAYGPAVEILADADCQGLGAQTGGRVVRPPPRTAQVQEGIRSSFKNHRVGACDERHM
jgi:hypothetical protein